MYCEKNEITTENCRCLILKTTRCLMCLCHAYTESMTLHAFTAGGKHYITAMHVERPVNCCFTTLGCNFLSVCNVIAFFVYDFSHLVYLSLTDWIKYDDKADEIGNTIQRDWIELILKYHIVLVYIGLETAWGISAMRLADGSRASETIRTSAPPRVRLVSFFRLSFALPQSHLSRPRYTLLPILKFIPVSEYLMHLLNYYFWWSWFFIVYFTCKPHF